MKALRVQVERVVRPIQASNLRKDRMREELLAHLTRMFDEELALASDTQFATAEAIRRFGNARMLARELQSSVPWLERWAFFGFPSNGPLRRRLGESPVRYILRSNVWGVAFGVAGYALIASIGAIVSSQRPRRVDQPGSGQMLIFVIAVAAIQFATMLVEGLLCEGIRRELERHAAAKTVVERRRAIWRIVGYTATSSAVIGAAIAAPMLVIAVLAPFPLMTRTLFWWITLGAAAIAVPLMLLESWRWKASTRRFENWELLDLDETEVA